MVGSRKEPRDEQMGEIMLGEDSEAGYSASTQEGVQGQPQLHSRTVRASVSGYLSCNMTGHDRVIAHMNSEQL